MTTTLTGTRTRGSGVVRNGEGEIRARDEAPHPTMRAGSATAPLRLQARPRPRRTFRTNTLAAHIAAALQDS